MNSFKAQKIRLLKGESVYSGTDIKMEREYVSIPVDMLPTKWQTLPVITGSTFVQPAYVYLGRKDGLQASVYLKVTVPRCYIVIPNYRRRKYIMGKIIRHFKHTAIEQFNAQHEVLKFE